MPDHRTTLENEPDFAQPWAPHRLRIYTGVALFTVAMFVLLTVGGDLSFLITKSQVQTSIFNCFSF